VTHFNDATNGFLVSSVNRIHRINWDQITPPSTLISKYSSNVTGSVNLEGKDILLVDFEYIVAELFPGTKMDHNLELSDIHKELAREDAKLIFAEDSAFIRNSVCTLLKQVGYNHVATFENGAAAFDYFTSLVRKAEREAKPLSDFVNLVITDIEMPKMDGLTLCRRIKKELNISTVPVALFSSLIDEQMVEKCKEVGADIYATKPKIGELVLLIDGILRIKK
jgi:two-component system chemotaxis response regulator CheV